MTLDPKPLIQGVALIQLLLLVVALLLVAGVGYLLLGETKQPLQVHPAAQMTTDTVIDDSATAQPPLQSSSPIPSVAQNNIATVVKQPTPLRPLDQTSDSPRHASLSRLNQSDGPFRSALLLLAPGSSLADWLIDEELIRKLVVTIDNMAEGRIPRKHALLLPMKDKFKVSKKGLALWLDGYNHSRYNAYVELLASIDSQQWLDLYLNYYPLMQRAYAELGYPRKAFHDRVLMAVDQLLNSPVVAKPMALEQPSVMYTFADPKLQALSAIDKQMLRLGAANARKLKASLTVLRAKLVAVKP